MVVYITSVMNSGGQSMYSLLSNDLSSVIMLLTIDLFYRIHCLAKLNIC